MGIWICLKKGVLGLKYTAGVPGKEVLVEGMGVDEIIPRGKPCVDVSYILAVGVIHIQLLAMCEYGE